MEPLRIQYLLNRESIVQMSNNGKKKQLYIVTLQNKCEQNKHASSERFVVTDFGIYFYHKH